MPDLNYAELPEGENTKESWAAFSFAHMAQHRDYIRVVFQRYGVRLAEYVLDPIDPKNLGSWPTQHQLMHNQLDAILQIPGYNLMQIDFNDPAGLQAWSDLHADSHTRESSILGL